MQIGFAIILLVTKVLLASVTNVIQNISTKPLVCNPTYNNTLIIGQIESQNEPYEVEYKSFNYFQIHPRLDGLCFVLAYDRWRYNDEYIINEKQKQLYYKFNVCFAQNSTGSEKNNIEISNKNFDLIFDNTHDLRTFLESFINDSFESAQNLHEISEKCQNNTKASDISNHKKSCKEFFIKVKLDKTGRKILKSILSVFIIKQKIPKTLQNYHNIQLEDLVCPNKELKAILKVLQKYGNIKDKYDLVKSMIEKCANKLNTTKSCKKGKMLQKNNKQKHFIMSLNQKKYKKLVNKLNLYQEFIELLDYCITISRKFLGDIDIRYKEKMDDCDLVALKANRNFDIKFSDRANLKKRVYSNRINITEQDMEIFAKIFEPKKNGRRNKSKKSDSKQRRDLANKSESVGLYHQSFAIILVFGLILQLFFNIFIK